MTVAENRKRYEWEGMCENAKCRRYGILEEGNSEGAEENREDGCER